MKLKIRGRGEWEVADVREASAVYCRVRKESGEGGSTFPTGRISGLGGTYYVSYNGKVWAQNPAAKDWTPDRTPVHDPYGG